MTAAPVAPGDVLAGRYRVDRVLGKGGMGVVVAATHVQLGQQVAVKFLQTGDKIGPEQRERFLREGRAAARLKSQHVTRVLDVGALADGSPYTVMELLHGRDLKAVLEARGPLPWAEAVEYALQVCEALAEAHAAGIVHRDIKPANLFLTTDASRAPCIKIFDFGISKVSGDLSLTSTEASIGSPLYMSPEQINSARDVDGRADLWSLGATLYQLITGRTPFDADKIEQLMLRIFNDAPTPMRAHRPDVPPGLEAVILRCFEKDRERRYPHAAALAAALAPFAPSAAAAYPDRVARVLGVSPEPIPAPAPAPAPAPVPAPRPIESTHSHVALAVTHAAQVTTAQAPAASPAPRSSALPIFALAGAFLAVAIPAGLWAAFRNTAAPPASASIPAVTAPSAPIPVPPAASAAPEVRPAPSASAPPLAATGTPAAARAPIASPAPPGRVRPPTPATGKKPSIW